MVYSVLLYRLVPKKVITKLASCKYNILYGRPSQKGDRLGESNSIQNQRAMGDCGQCGCLHRESEAVYIHRPIDAGAMRLFIQRIEIGKRSEKGSRNASQSIRIIYRVDSAMLPGEAEPHIIPAITMDNIRKMTA